MLREESKSGTLPLHPDESILLAYRDGELAEKTAHAVRRHLAQCWECSTRLREIEQAIAWLLASELRTEDIQVPPVGPALAELRARISEARRGSPVDPLSPGFRLLRLKHNRLAIPLAWSILGLALFLSAALIYNRSQPRLVPEASAAEIINRVRQSENARIFAPGRIVHQVLRYEQKGGASSVFLPDGQYWIERWWDNTKIPRPMVYRMRNANGELVSGSWIFGDGSSVRYERYTRSGGPRLTYGPPIEEMRRYIGTLPQERKVYLEKLLSLTWQNLDFYERSSLARWQKFVEEIRAGQTGGSVKQARLDGEPIYIVTADRFDDELKQYRWIAKVRRNDFRVLEARVVAPLIEGACEMSWVEIGFEVFEPNQAILKAFEVDQFPDGAIKRRMTIEESIQQLERNGKNFLQK